ncbi:hypothetical protein [Melittangium boletus]|uniref:Uncharacterized protein n=1 Tax=Melittangium boletus DSM 14713 TaxID=1294270 RepID=A0A250ILK6_9BACT|nr:hypothetical protein [Melittangium boletus]ATB32110.1 hypothetical protein MEBOL_005586 [Melittangium boletus DSM 14713]
MLPLLWIVGAVVGVGLVVHFWDKIRDTVASWLRQLGLDQSRLMDAWILLDRVVSGVRCRIYAKTTQGQINVKETSLSMDEIDDQEVLDQLKRRATVKRDVMEYVD